MCGRYAFFDLGDLRGRFGVQNELTDFKGTYNAAPGMRLPIIVKQSPTQVTLMRWGLIPSWAKDPKIGYRMINARAETVDQKPAYRKLLLSQRCLVPLNGFYEWQHNGVKVPFFIHPVKEKVCAAAGLWDVWQDAEGKELKTFTIITTQANSDLLKIHDRMPVVLAPSDEQVWLDKTVTEVKLLKSLLRSASIGRMKADPVSDKVNSAVNDTPELIKPRV